MTDSTRGDIHLYSVFQSPGMCPVPTLAVSGRREGVGDKQSSTVVTAARGCDKSVEPRMQSLASSPSPAGSNHGPRTSQPQLSSLRTGVTPVPCPFIGWTRGPNHLVLLADSRGLKQRPSAWAASWSPLESLEVLILGLAPQRCRATWSTLGPGLQNF